MDFETTPYDLYSLGIKNISNNSHYVKRIFIRLSGSVSIFLSQNYAERFYYCYGCQAWFVPEIIGHQKAYYIVDPVCVFLH